MTREEKELIFNQLFELEGRHPAFAENVRDNAYCEAIADVKHIIERINETSLPSDLDEAAEDSWAVYEYRESPRGLYSTCYVDGFKSGAEWMAEQGITKEAVIGMATEEISINVSEQTLDELDLRPGDKVVVQIRKK